MPETYKDIPAAAPEVCVHRWLLEAPVGEVTRGRCKLCGADRDFTDERRSGSYSRLPRNR